MNESVIPGMNLHDACQRPLRRDDIVFLQHNNVSNLYVSFGLMPLGVTTEGSNILRRPPLPKVTNQGPGIGAIDGGERLNGRREKGLEELLGVSPRGNDLG